jgi:2'-5' RNA ligase
VGTDQAGTGPVGPREVSFHPAAKKELVRLDGDSRKRVANTINALQRGDDGLQTHALTPPLKGWSSTKASRGHRIIHRDLDDGTLHIGYVGLHEYGKAINRLASLIENAFAKEAAAVVNDDGVMVAFVPPREIAEQLAMDNGQPVDDLHITLAHLGNAADYKPEQLQRLPRVVAAWAASQRPVTIRVGGVGTFNNSHKDQHVLYAAMDIPGGAQAHSSLAQHLQRHGYRLPSEHGWTPHMTLRYVDKHHRFMPHLETHSWESAEVVTYVRGERHPARLGAQPSTLTTL